MRNIIFIILLSLLLGLIGIAYFVPVASKPLYCVSDTRYSILLGQRQAYDNAKDQEQGPDYIVTKGVCAKGTVSLYVL